MLIPWRVFLSWDVKWDVTFFQAANLFCFREGIYNSGQITIIPNPELSDFKGDSLTKPRFTMTLVEVAIICPVQWYNSQKVA